MGKVTMWPAMAPVLALLLFQSGGLELSGADEDTSAPEIPLAAPPDEAIRGRVRAVVGALGDVRELTVEVEHGVVRLEGLVAGAEARERVVRIASRVEGVVYVDSSLRSDADLSSRLSPVGDTLRGYLTRALAFLPVLALAAAVFGLFYLLARHLGRKEHPFAGLGVSALSARVLAAGLQLALLIAGVVLALYVLGAMEVVGAMVGTLGLIGIVVGLAFRDMVSAYLPGLLLALDPPFAVGDRVRLAGHEGRVVRISPRETVLLSLDGEHLRIPNAQVFTGSIVNDSRHRERRVSFPAYLAPEADLRRARDAGCRALAGVRAVAAEPPPFMRVKSLTAENTEVRFYAWADQDAANFRNTESRARRAVLEALLEAGIPLAEDRIRVLQGPPPSPSPGERGAEDAVDDRSEAESEAFLANRLAKERRAPEQDLLEEGAADREVT